MTVWLLIMGSGDDGDECYVKDVYSSLEKAVAARKELFLESRWNEGRVGIEQWEVK